MPPVKQNNAQKPALDAMSPDEEAAMAQMREQDGEQDDAGDKSGDDTQKADDTNADGKSAPEDDADDDAAGDNAGAADAAKSKNKMVPHEALHKEREENKALKKRIEEDAKERIKLDERLNILNEVITKASQSEAPKKAEYVEVPDPEKDALGALKALQHNYKLSQEETKTLKEFRDNSNKNRESSAFITTLLGEAQQQEVEFVKTHPDYQQASAYLMGNREAEYIALGHSPAEAKAAVARETLELATIAKNQRKSAPELVYTLATGRGYRPATDNGGGQNNQDNNGQGNGAGGGLTEAQKIAALAAAQRANRSLGDLGGSAPPSKRLDSKGLASMSDEKFMEVVGKLTEAQQRELMGD